LAKSREFIKDKLIELDWEEMQELVAGILRGMGYKTIVSTKGPDRGRDILASPDGLGLNEPRIVVEVKHRSGQMGSPEIRSFTGGLRPGDKGLYVSIGGYTREAKYEAERANNPLTLVDADLLVTLIIQYYDDFDTEARALIPLTKIYWPA
jgi:restriction system protein